MTTASTREYRKCPACGEYRHDYMYPFADPASQTYPRPAKTGTSKALAAHVKRLADAVLVRVAAQAKGRDYSRCLPCVNGDA